VGEAGALSHSTAAAIWELGQLPPELVHVTVVARNLRQRLGLRIHRAQELDSRDVRLRDGLPVTAPARTLVDLAGCCEDFLWREANLVVEVDGHAFHASRPAFERDRRPDHVLGAAGYSVIRVTWPQLAGEPMAVAVRLGQALARDR
jgi:very-short-patch-repair endonuclease